MESVVTRVRIKQLFYLSTKDFLVKFSKIYIVLVKLYKDILCLHQGVLDMLSLGL